MGMIRRPWWTEATGQIWQMEDLGITPQNIKHYSILEHFAKYSILYIFYR